MKRFREGLVFKAHRPLYHSTLGSRIIKKKREEGTGTCELALDFGGALLHPVQRVLFPDTPTSLLPTQLRNMASRIICFFLNAQTSVLLVGHGACVASAEEIASEGSPLVQSAAVKVGRARGISRKCHGDRIASRNQTGKHSYILFSRRIRSALSSSES